MIAEIAAAAAGPVNVALILFGLPGAALAVLMLAGLVVPSSRPYVRGLVRDIARSRRRK